LAAAAAAAAAGEAAAGFWPFDLRSARSFAMHSLQHSRFTESIITTAAAGREPHSLHKRSVTETNEKVSSKSSQSCNALVSV
jgi:hypothetical protein